MAGLFLLILATFLDLAATLDDSCDRKQTCHECLESPWCAWCFQPDYKGLKRCFETRFRANSVPAPSCENDFIVNPMNTMKTIENKKLGTRLTDKREDDVSEKTSFPADSERSVQIAPQVINLTLRPNRDHSFKLEFHQSRHYPVDLYYLMDMSESMKPHKTALEKLGETLAKGMKKITENYRIGFGTFLDKAVMPFYIDSPKQCEFKDFCKNENASYSFRHMMLLSQNTGRFVREVKNAKISKNLDAPEGGFDALMQVMVCKKEIGWRDNSRKLIIYSTDFTYHYAGDGKLGGIVVPNDGKCHMVNGNYTHSLRQDYPSVSHINYVAAAQKVNIIFAIASNKPVVQEAYRRLSLALKGASYGVLESTSNVMDLISKQYDQIRSSIQFEATSSKHFEVKFRTNCNTSTDWTDKCTNLKVGDRVEFYVDVKLLRCPKDRSEWNEQFEIRPAGLNESLAVNVKMLCDCPCENEGSEGYEKKSKRCSGFGTDKCGVCECDDEHIGEDCRCRRGDISLSNETIVSNCRPDNVTTEDCSGRGKCVCGQCECDDENNVRGQYCECDNKSCFRLRGKLCSGNGACECGQCVCNEGYVHQSPNKPVCDCYNKTTGCISPDRYHTDEVCFGRGVCDCGECTCNAGFKGAYCELFSVMLKDYQRCNEFEPCVECLAYKTGRMLETDKNCSAKCSFKLELVADLETEMAARSEAMHCVSKDVNGCFFSFLYYYEKKEAMVIAQEGKPVCTKPDVLKYVWYVTLGIVLAGIVLLFVWKMATMTIDRMEYIKFQKQQAKAKWDTGGNPLYKAPTSSFQNPMYTDDLRTPPCPPE